MDRDLIKFKTLIEKKAGLRMTDDKKLCFAIEEMIVLNGVKSEKELLELVSKDIEVFENLVGFLTINETYFFREASQIEVFSNDLIPSLVNNGKGNKINILSAGCSTGAEPYSLVIALMEKYGAHINHLFSVKGFDIDKKTLKIAEEGIYGKYHFRGIDNSIIDKYFDKVSGDRYKIKGFVSDMVDFYPHNLLHSSFPDAFNEIHVLFYRNVSIYFSRENQKKIFINLSKMLCQKGWLIMSSTETLSHDFQILSLTKVNDLFLYQKEINALEEQDRFPKISGRKFLKTKKQKILTAKKTERFRNDNSTVVSQKAVTQPSEPEILLPETQMRTAWGLAKNREYKESLAAIDSIIGKGAVSAKVYTMKASVLINLNKFAEAKDACLKAHEIDEFWPESFFLLGIISKFENDLEDSEENFKKTIYIDSSCWLAHYYLAEIYRDWGEIEKSFKKYEIVIKQLEKVKTMDTDVLFSSFTFSEKELIHACKSNMKKLMAS